MLGTPVAEIDDREHDLSQDRLSKDYILTSVMLYWATDTAASAARLYHDAEDNAWAEAESTQRSGLSPRSVLYETRLSGLFRGARG